MPSTEQLEDFREFICQPLDQLIGNSKGMVSSFCSQLLKKYEYVIGEARRNKEEYLKEGNDPSLFLNDMKIKVGTTEEMIFKETKRGIIYRPLGCLVEDKGNLRNLYLSEIYTITQKLKKYFEANLQKPSDNLIRRTSYPSFTVQDSIILDDAFNQLIKFGYLLPEETDQKDFTAIFTGRIIHKPLIWHGGNGSLAYFIRGVINSNNILKIRNKEHWLVTQKCFVNYQKEILDTDQLRNSAPPSNTDNLDMVIQSFTLPTED